MELGIKNKTALITGASKGLGFYIASALAKEGCNIGICARNKDEIKSAEKKLTKLGIKVLGIEADVTTNEGTNEAYSATVNSIGPIDILINNVGGSTGRTFDTTTDEDWKNTFDLNLLSGVQLIRLCLPDMKNKSWGRIINISSIYGREYGGGLTYMATKSALISMSKHLALDLAGTGITVNTIAPGSIYFEGGRWERFQKENTKEFVEDFIKNNLPMGKFGWPEPVGATVAFLCSAQAALITGACINVDGGQSHNLF